MHSSSGRHASKATKTATLRTTTESEYEYSDFDKVISGDTIKRISMISVVFQVVGIVLIILILLLSVNRRTSSRINLVPRIFTVNLMLINLVHSLAGFFFDLSVCSTEFSMLLYHNGLYESIVGPVSNIQNVTFLVFCSSFVPMMLMTIATCYNHCQLSKVSSALTFGIVVLLADIVPIAFQAINYAVSKNRVLAVNNTRHFIFAFALYFSQIGLTFLALWLLYRRFAASPKSTQSAKFQRNKRRFLMFSTAPNFVLVVFALCQIMIKLRGISQFMMDLDTVMHDVQHIVFAMKPSIDALSTLLFLGEYRQHLTAAGYAVGRWLAEKCHRASTHIVTIEPTRTSSLVAQVRPSQTLHQRRSATVSS